MKLHDKGGMVADGQHSVQHRVVSHPCLRSLLRVPLGRKPVFLFGFTVVLEFIKNAVVSLLSLVI